MSQAPVADTPLYRAPLQGRSHATLARIVDAAETLFGQNGYAGTTVGDIVAVARCSVGSFYARFSDKDSLFLHIHEARCRAQSERIGFLRDLLNAENATLDTAVRQTVRTLTRLAADSQPLTRAFMERAIADPAFQRRDDRHWSGIRQILRTLFLARRREISHPDPQRAAEFVVRLLCDAWASRALDRDGPARPPADPWADELTTACLAYLGAGRRDFT